MESKKTFTRSEICRVFTMYFGQKHVIVLDQAAAEHQKRPYSSPIPIVNETLRYLQLSEDNPAAGVEFKLLLKPLSTITDEDIAELGKLAIAFPNPDPADSTIAEETIIDNIIRHSDHLTADIDCRCFSGCLKIHFDGKIWFFEEDDRSQTEFELGLLHQYLISEGYDVPLFFSPGHPMNGRTAIEAGIGIEANQTWWQTLGIKFDGTWYTHPKTNTYDNPEQVAEELKNWKKPATQPEETAVSSEKNSIINCYNIEDKYLQSEKDNYDVTKKAWVKVAGIIRLKRELHEDPVDLQQLAQERLRWVQGYNHAKNIYSNSQK